MAVVKQRPTPESRRIRSAAAPIFAGSTSLLALTPTTVDALFMLVVAAQRRVLQSARLLNHPDKAARLGTELRDRVGAVHHPDVSAVRGDGTETVELVARAVDHVN